MDPISVALANLASLHDTLRQKSAKGRFGGKVMHPDTAKQFYTRYSALVAEVQSIRPELANRLPKREAPRVEGASKREAGYVTPDELSLLADDAACVMAILGAIQQSGAVGAAPNAVTPRTQPFVGEIPALRASRVFIGHGRSDEWRRLAMFLLERLNLPYEEFNREPVAGLATKERLVQMLESSSFALLVMTAEDEHLDGSHHARENVIHEIGLFQGRHGFSRAIVLLEEDCAEFSNIAGVAHIRFPKGNVLARSEDIRRVLEREGLL